jgi:hypothetical protein
MLVYIEYILVYTSIDFHAMSYGRAFFHAMSYGRVFQDSLFLTIDYCISLCYSRILEFISLVSWDGSAEPGRTGRAGPGRPAGSTPTPRSSRSARGSHMTRMIMAALGLRSSSAPAAARRRHRAGCTVRLARRVRVRARGHGGRHGGVPERQPPTVPGQVAGRPAVVRSE